MTAQCPDRTDHDRTDVSLLCARPTVMVGWRRTCDRQNKDFRRLAYAGRALDCGDNCILRAVDRLRTVL